MQNIDIFSLRSHFKKYLLEAWLAYHYNTINIIFSASTIIKQFIYRYT